MDKLKVFSETPVMGQFESAFTGGGTYCSVDCQFCGRIYFTDNKGDFEEGELVDLHEKRLKNPDKYKISEYDCIGYGRVDGKQIVWECECNGAKQYQDFILSHAGQIANFLSMYADKVEALAKQKREHANLAKKINDAK